MSQNRICLNLRDFCCKILAIPSDTLVTGIETPALILELCLTAFSEKIHSTLEFVMLNQGLFLLASVAFQVQMVFNIDNADGFLAPFQMGKSLIIGS